MTSSRENSAEETARIGNDVYTRLVSPHWSADDRGRIVAIDVRSEAWTIDESGMAAAKKLRQSHANAEVWLVRVGDAAYHRIGGQSRRNAS